MYYQSLPVCAEDRTINSFTSWSDSAASVFIAESSVSDSLCELITDQIFVKGDGVLPFPFDGKGELSALNVELRNGK